jgi:tight adherence protein B
MATATPFTVLGFPVEYVVFAGILACLLIAVPMMMQLTSPQQKMRAQAKKMQHRVKDKTTFKSKREAEAEEETKSLRREEGDKSLPLFTRLLNNSNIGHALRDRVARSGFNITAERYVFYNAMLFAVAVLAFTLLFKLSFTLALLLAIIIGFGVPNTVMNMRINRRTKKFLILFPDAIDLIVRGLRAGLPVTESIKMVAKEIEEPVNQIFQTMTEKMALGVPLEKTLYDTALKYRITEFDFFVTSIVLQRETGGNLSEILNNLSEALRQRLMMRLKIKAMSSEARASMYIIGALPFVVVAALKLTSPDYLEPLFNDFRGNIALAVAGSMLSAGVFIMSRMAKFEI